MVTFQILDCYSQDLKVIKETSSEKQVEYVEHEDFENEDNYHYQYFEMVIHLFGTTADNKSLRVSVANFQPYFYIELPDSKKSTFTRFQEELPEKILQSMTEENKKQIENTKKQIDIAEKQLDNTENLNHKKLLSKLKFLKEIANHLKEEAVHLHENTQLQFIKKEKLYGYTNKYLFPFVKLSVSSMKDFRNLTKVFLDHKNNPKHTYNVYEANLDPMLRFFHLRNIKPCGWVNIDTEYSENIDVDWNDVDNYNNQSVAPFVCGFWDIECYSANGDFPLAKKDYYKTAKQLYNVANSYLDVKVLLTNAIVTPFEKGKIDGIFLKYTIPTNSILENYLSGNFKQRVEDLFSKKETMEKDDFILSLNNILRKLIKNLPIAGDPIIQIGIVFSSNGLGEKHIFVLNDCDPVEGVIVHNCKTEKDMILGFMKLVTDKNTDMLLGYNTFGFDMKYVHERMEQLGITTNDVFQNLSRIIDISKGKPVVLQEKKLASSALGDNTLYLWTTTGRLHIDLYFYIKRIENLPSYKLDDVCRYYMSGKLKSIDISKKDTWTIETGNTSDAEVGKYLVLLDEMGDTIVEKRKILEVLPKKIVLESIEEHGDLDTVVSWAIVKDDVSPAEIFRLHREGGEKGRAIVAKYCIQDCVLVYQLFNKLDVFNNAMAMANTCSVPISYIFTRGQGIKCESLIFKECAARNQLIKVQTNPNTYDDDDEVVVEESYEGAIVLVPEPNFYVESPIGVADFASLYPSTIYSENISYDTLLWAKDFNMNGKCIGYSFGSEDAEKYLDPSVDFTDIEFDIWAPDPADTRKNPEKIKTGLRVCRYVQQANDAKGTLPNIVAALLASRKAKRKEAEKENDPFKKALLDAEQLAYKLTANSLYGQLGSSTFKVRLQHLAASTTAYGRKQILFAKDAIERFYGPGAGDPRCAADGAKIVYGDSVAYYTPIIIRRNGLIEIIAIEELGDNWIPYENSEKEFCKLKDVESWTEQGWTPIETIIRHTLAPTKKMIRVVTKSAIVDVTDDHSLIRLSGEEISPKDVKVGDKLLHHEYPQGKLNKIMNMSIPSEDNDPLTIEYTNYIDWQKYMAHSAFILSSYGYNISFSIDNSSKTIGPIYRITSTKKTSILSSNAIKKLYEIPYSGYVYDLTTSNHHFQAGIGKMIVHNTDSLFVNFNVMNPETGERLKGKEAIHATMELTEEAGKFVTRCLKKPHDFEYDKVFYPFIIFSKKRYVGNKFEGDADSYKQTSMGIATKRRDYAGIVKNVYGGAIKILLNEKNSVKAFDFVKKTCNDLVDGKISDHQLTLTKSLRSEYKAATPPAHKMLADRITARDPGNAPSSGERLQFMYVMPPVGQTASKLQGNRIETPAFIKENKLKIDYKYYIEHQIYNPITQLFGLFVEHLPGYVMPQKPMAIEEKEHYAGELLFRDIYTKCNNQSVRSFAQQFGFEIKTSSSKTSSSKAITHVQTKATKKKEVINFPKLDRYLISNYEKEKKEKSKEVKEKEKEKEKEKLIKKKSGESSVNEYIIDM